MVELNNKYKIGNRRFGINWVGVYSLYLKETLRFLTVFGQTVVGPIITAVLFLLVISLAIGEARSNVLGVTFIEFLAPGLIAMQIIQQAFSHSSSSLLMGKIMGNIVDLIGAPLSAAEVSLSIVLAAVTRALIISIVSFYNGIDFSWSIALFGAIFAFFLFNIGVLGKKFQIFLGDSGTIPLGFFLAWILVFLSQEPNKVIEPVSAIWIVLIPLVDALSTFYRRIRAGQGIFLGDRHHIHFILLDGGLSKNLTLTILSLLSLLGALIALYFLINPVQPYYMFYGFLTIWVFYLLLTKNTPKK